MLSFAPSLSPNSSTFALFVTEKYEYKDVKGLMVLYTQKVKWNFYVQGIWEKRNSLMLG